MKKHFIIIIGCLFLLIEAKANNLVIVSPPSYSSVNNTLTFTISWENSWSINAGPTNWDAVWIFVKRQNCSGNNNWVHQLLSTTPTDHFVNTVSTNAISTITQVNAVTDGMGVFVRRIGTNVAGNVAAQLVTIKLGSTNPAITTSTSDNFDIVGIEMVYVPQGNFSLGDGRAVNTSNFSAGSTNQPLTITSAIQAAGIGAYSNYTAKVANGSPSPLPATFPLGYNGFYCMKYELNQGTVAEYLTTLTYDQQANLFMEYGTYRPNVAGNYFGPWNSYSYTTRVDVKGTFNTVAASFITSYPFMPFGGLTWPVLTSFLDWSGLRPMTEFEYEKACRGTLPPIANEYPWGSTTITNNRANADNYGSRDAIATIVEGSCFYTGWDGSSARNGAHASANSNRSQAGATYYGILDIGGNQNEQCVGGGFGYNYSTFTVANGNGDLSSTGFANVTGWPTDGGLNSGTILRGGNYEIGGNTYLIEVSDRTYVQGSNLNHRSGWDRHIGGRGVRTY
jgi:formylglycine-generating enzyme required for sulfatase activity